MDGASYMQTPMGIPLPAQTFPPAPEDVKQKLQNQLPFQQETGREAMAPVNMYRAPVPAPQQQYAALQPQAQVPMPAAFGSSMPSSLQSQAAYANMSEEQFRGNLRMAADRLETRIKDEVEGARARIRREMMLAGGIILAFLSFLTWRSFRRTPGAT